MFIWCYNVDSYYFIFLIIFLKHLKWTFRIFNVHLRKLSNFRKNFQESSPDSEFRIFILKLRKTIEKSSDLSFIIQISGFSLSISFYIF